MMSRATVSMTTRTKTQITAGTVRQRSMEIIYGVVFLDAIHYHVRSEACHDGYHQEMDRTQTELEHNPCPNSYLYRESGAGLKPPCPAP